MPAEGGGAGKASGNGSGPHAGDPDGGAFPGAGANGGSDALPAGGRFTKHFMEIAVGTLLLRFRMLK